MTWTCLAACSDLVFGIHHLAQHHRRPPRVSSALRAPDVEHLPPARHHRIHSVPRSSPRPSRSDARAPRPERLLVDHYNPLAMSPELLRAHRELDAAVDKTLGLRGAATEADRLRALSPAPRSSLQRIELAMPKKRPRKARAVSAAS
ncbi:MAG: type IIL restriction-modification enzyme MmeI [Mycobacterium sp.]|nr:type IIL restriction-modification enzyme MmeI [Mycobacterium sp.]